MNITIKQNDAVSVGADELYELHYCTLTADIFGYEQELKLELKVVDNRVVRAEINNRELPKEELTQLRIFLKNNYFNKK